MKNIIIGDDGTWVDLGENQMSNIGRLFQILNKRTEQNILQISNYDPGVGTNGAFDRMHGGTTGEGLEANIKEAYIYLMNNYEPGDKIFLFGFSRGAYTVRSLAGLLHHVGLLTTGNAPKVKQAFDLYKNRLEKNKPEELTAQEFKNQFSIGVDIAFLGVFDTVDALGIPWFYDKFKKFRYHDVSLVPEIKVAMHAVAADEIRYDFMYVPFADSEDDVLPEVEPKVKQKVFPGVHSDIGGGYEDSHGLSDIALQWMVKHAVKQGLSVNWDNYPDFKPDPEAPMHDSYKGIMPKITGGYHERHLCNKEPGHLFKPRHTFFRASQYPIEPDTKPSQAKCTNYKLSIDKSFFQRQRAMSDYRPANVELGVDPDVLQDSSDSCEVIALNG